MSPREYFLYALRNGLYKHLAWINDAFAVVESDETTADDYTPRLVRKGNTLTTEIDGEVVTFQTEKLKPLLSFWDELLLGPGDLPTVENSVTTTYGEALFNMYVLFTAFGTQIPYQAGRLTDGRLEELIGFRIEDDPEGEMLPPSERPHGALYASEMKVFVDSLAALTAINRLVVPSMSDKALTVSKEVIEFRDSEIARLKAEGKFTAEEVIKLEAKLSEMDKASFEGDESEGFYVNPTKSFGNTRKKVHVMIGVEPDFTNPGKTYVNPRSLSEGVKVDDWVAHNNAARAGSFSRGALTALAGQTAKEAQRATQNLKITMEDCGTQETIQFMVNSDHVKDRRLVNRWMVDGAKLKLIDEEVMAQLNGKLIKLRDPQRCKAGKQEYCAICCGVAMARTPDAVGAEITEINNVFMNTMMKAMHNTSQTLASYDPMLYIS